MKILVVGDKESPYIYDHFDRERLGDVDFVISTGDLSADYLSYIVTLLNVPLYYVPGNHDKQYLAHPPEGCVNIDRKILSHNGLRIMGFGGSRWYNGGYFQYTERQTYFSYLKMKPRIMLGGGVDIFVTHAPAWGMCDGKDRCHMGFETYRKIIDVYKPHIFIHGHQHLTYGISERVSKHHETTRINSFGYYLFDYHSPAVKL